jgi:hypothetical protein
MALFSIEPDCATHGREKHPFGEEHLVRTSGTNDAFPPGIKEVTMKRALCFIAAGIVLTACTPPREPVPITPPGDSKDASVVRRPLPEPARPPVASVVPTAPALAPPAPPVVVPAGSIYVCVSDTGGARQQTAIEFSPKVGAMCAKHPEMGPCQYERDICRRSGGRVYAAGGVEITQQTEADYDKKVMRVRFKAN